MKINSLLIATKNPKKTSEFRALLRDLPVSLLDLTSFDNVNDVDETGDTFEQNASLKASAYARATNHWSLADDSGLEVDALGNKPGIHSARWAMIHGRRAGDKANNELLLEQLRDVDEGSRGAKFICVLALANPAGQVVLTVRDQVEGTILRSAVGGQGFGYDPLFFYAPLAKTMAELTCEEKHLVSHRGRAMKQLLKLIRRMQVTG